MILRGLLRYKGWMFEGRGQVSLFTRVWAALLTVFSKGLFYKFISKVFRSNNYSFYFTTSRFNSSFWTLKGLIWILRFSRSLPTIASTAAWWHYSTVLSQYERTADWSWIRKIEGTFISVVVVLTISEKLATLYGHCRAHYTGGVGEEVVDIEKLCHRLVGDLCLLEATRQYHD